MNNNSPYILIWLQVILLFPFSFNQQPLNNQRSTDVIESENNRHILRHSQNGDRSQDIFLNNILVRRLARLLYGDKCDPSKQIILDNPTKFVNKTTFSKLNDNLTANATASIFAEEVLKWQMALLQNRQPFCNYKLNLECSIKTSTCQCKIGKFVDIQIGSKRAQHCVLLEGDNCGEDYDDETFYFDPVKNLESWTRSKSPACIQNSTCTTKQFFYNTKCWCDPGKSCENNMGITTKELDMIIDRNAVIADNFILNIDSSCNHNFQNNLLNPSPTERIKTADRLDRLHTLSDYGVNFCSINLYLNCTDTTNQCDCWRSLTFEKGHCRIKNYYPCSKSYQLEGQFYPTRAGAPYIWETSRMLQVQLNPECIEAATCKKYRSDLYQCSCKNPNSAGALCNETKSVLINLFDNPNIWPFPNDELHNEMYHQFNYYFNIIEGRMSLPYDSTCHSKNFQYFEALLKFFLQISRPPKYGGGNSVQQFEAALEWLILVTDSNFTLCNGFHGLRCLPIEKKCRCKNDFHWDPSSKACQMNHGTNCELSYKPPHMQSPIWNFNCSTDSSCTEGLSSKQCKCNKGRTGPKCQFKMRSQIEKIGSRVPPSSKHFTNKTKSSNNFLFSFLRNRQEQGLTGINKSGLRRDKNNTISEFKSNFAQFTDAKQKSRSALNGTTKSFFSAIYDSGSSEDVYIGFPDPKLFNLSDVSDQSHSSSRTNNQSYSTNKPRNQLYSTNITTNQPLRRNSPTNKSHSIRQSGSTAAINQMINNVLDSMKLGLNEPCNYSYDTPSSQLNFFTFKWSEFQLNLLTPAWVIHLFRTQTKVRCDGRLYLACSKVIRTCQCNETYDLIPGVGVDRRCYIMQNDLCGDKHVIGIHPADNRDPPSCSLEHICERTRFSVYRCRLLLMDELDLKNNIPIYRNSYHLLISCVVVNLPTVYFSQLILSIIIPKYLL